MTLNNALAALASLVIVLLMIENDQRRDVIDQYEEAVGEYEEAIASYERVIQSAQRKLEACYGGQEL